MSTRVSLPLIISMNANLSIKLSNLSTYSLKVKLCDMGICTDCDRGNGHHRLTSKAWSTDHDDDDEMVLIRSPIESSSVYSFGSFMESRYKFQYHSLP